MPAIDGRMDGRDVQIPTVFYRTLTPPVPSGPGGPGPLPCLQNSYHKKILKQGKGTDEHFLPLGDWLFLCFCPQLSVAKEMGCVSCDESSAVLRQNPSSTKRRWEGKGWRRGEGEEEVN